MYAVVKTGGKQHTVEVGETISVEKLDAAPGTTVTFPVLFVNDDEKILVGADAAAVTVSGEVLGHGKADKAIVFKFRKRKGSKTLRGHRQPLTLVKITDIAAAGAKPAKKAAAAESVAVEEKAAKPAAEKKPAAAKKPTAAKKPAAAKAETVEKPAAAKKPAAKKPAAPKAETAAKKPAAEKKPAAKKPAAKKTEKPAE